MARPPLDELVPAAPTGPMSRSIIAADRAGAHALIALRTFRRPPVSTTPASDDSGSTLFRIVARRFAVDSAHRDSSSAAAPDTCGVAIDVPLIVAYPPPAMVERMPTPGAASCTDCAP